MSSRPMRRPGSRRRDRTPGLGRRLWESAASGERHPSRPLRHTFPWRGALRCGASSSSSTDLPWRGRPRWEAAEALSFDHAWTYDHLVWGGLPEAPWTGAFRRSLPPRWRPPASAFGTFVASPNYRHPLRPCSATLVRSGRHQQRPLPPRPGHRRRRDAQRLGEDSLHQRVDASTSTSAPRSAVPEDPRRPRRRLLRGARRLHPARPRPRPYPLWVAATGPRSLLLAASSGDAWITHGGVGPDLEAWSGHVQGTPWGRFREAEAAAGRCGSGPKVPGPSPQFSLSSVGVFRGG